MIFFARYEVVLLSVQESRRVTTAVLALLFCFCYQADFAVLFIMSGEVV